MAFAGYLIKLGGSEGTELPMEYIQAESYAVENKVIEQDVRQAVTGITRRAVAGHRSSVVKFRAKSMNNTSLAALNELISEAMSDTTSRNITIEFYDPETDTYKEADCYMPSVKFTIRKVTGETELIYEPADYTFMEY